jgi:YVTN family beta-propeller protein
MKSLLIRKKTWLLVALLLVTTSCTVTTCKVGDQLVYFYDFSTRRDAYPFSIWDAENSSTGPVSLYSAPYGMATGVSFLPGTPAFGITSYYSNVNQNSWGTFFYTSDTLYRLNGITGVLQDSVPTTPALQNFQVAPNGIYGIGTSGASPNIYNFQFTPSLKLNYSFSLGSTANPYGIAISPDSSKVIVTDSKLPVFYRFNPAMQTYQPMTIPYSFLGKPAFSPDGLSYAIPFGGTNPGVAFYDNLTDTPITSIFGIPHPTEITFNHTGTKGYVLSPAATGNGWVFCIDTSKFNVGGNVMVGSGPMGFAWSPGYTTLFTANSGDGTISAIDITGRTPSASAVPVGTNPVGVALAPLSLRYSF